MPLAENDDLSGNYQVEDATVQIDVLANDTGGADDSLTLNSADVLTPGAGTASVVGGMVQFDPADNFAGEVQIQYEVQDADGDTDTAVLTLTYPPDSGPTLGPESGTVYEAALSPDGSGDAVPPGGSITASGTLDINTGNDTIGSVVIDGVDVTSGVTQVNTGSYGTLVITESNGNYSWEYTLDGPTSDHGPLDDGHNAIAENYSMVVTDSDGSDVSNTLTIDVVDDVPFIAPQNAILANEADNIVTAEINTIGADGLDTVVIAPHGAGDGDAVAGPGGPLTAFDGQSLVWNDNGDGSWSGIVANGEDNAGDIIFTVIPDASGTGSYSVSIAEMDGLDGSSIPLGFNFTSDGPSGAKSGEMLFFANEDGPIDFKNNELNNIDLKVDPGDAQLSVTATSDGLPADVNSSAQGMGVDTGAQINNDDHDILTLNISKVADPVNGISTDDIPFQVSNVHLTLNHLNTDEVAHWKVGYHDAGDPGADANGIVWIAEGDYQGISDGGSSPGSDEVLHIDVVNFLGDPNVTILDADFNPTTAGFDVIQMSDASPESSNSSGFGVLNMTSEGVEIPGFDSSIEMDIAVTDHDHDSSATETVSIVFDSTGEIAGINGESDAIMGSSSADTILADDGVMDSIDGGAGLDTIDADNLDHLVPDAVDPDHII